jgi:hypothetical protein
MFPILPSIFFSTNHPGNIHKYILKLNLLFSFLLVFLAGNTFAQDDSLIGKWKVLAVDNGEFYFNSELDSVFFTDELKIRYNETSKIENLKKMARMLYIDQTFTFTEDNQLIIKNIMQPLTSFYKKDSQSPRLFVYESEEKQDSPDFLINYHFQDSRLFIEMTVTDPPIKFEFAR